MLKDRCILLGVSGGIACYKAVELLRLLKQAGANVTVVMTANAQKFVTPLTFQTLSGNPALTDTFRLENRSEIEHIAAVDRSELFVIAPATANLIGKIAGGVADDMVTTMALACTTPLLIAPAMNVHMWENPVLQQNIAKLKALKHEVIEPGEGELACGYVGAGRMAEPETIFEHIQQYLGPQDLKEETILVTAGPTQETLDPVRVLTNRSSGKMGYAIAQAAKRRGAQVILISGPTRLSPPIDVEYHSVTTTQEMRDAVMKAFTKATIIIKAAAVSDFRPAQVHRQKIKKVKGKVQWLMEETPDILGELGRKKGSKILVGFAAETERLEENARKKLLAKNLDLIVANDVTEPGAGFEVDTNRALLLDKKGGVQDLPLMPKIQLASKILDRVVALRQQKQTERR
ncbi:MAG: bifunctional phosphopantothenoylcysteine decarboxylase/phosphopantothenate--cysteine ligase CoaBC [Deltaproteobacteria bacterium]|nr:bifunctional phosphopantothenoylcysteine decarboxylase/phosphopantothenate--cysteine ligase CoaBC [Deltaproteobacteria bacterium]